MGLQKFGDSTAGRQLQQDLRQGTPAHAYLLAGSLCRDKEEIVSLFVQALLCREPADGNPCALCPSCQAWVGMGSCKGSGNKGLSMGLLTEQALANELKA